MQLPRAVKAVLPDNCNAENALDLFSLYFTDNLISLLVKHTNLYAIQKGAQDWKVINEKELHIFFGILIYMGIYHCPELPDYWNSNKESLKPFHPIQRYMSRDRFLDLRCYFHISDPTKPAPQPKPKKTCKKWSTKAAKKKSTPEPDSKEDDSNNDNNDPYIWWHKVEPLVSEFYI
jgi:hypothetical protein